MKNVLKKLWFVGIAVIVGDILTKLAVCTMSSPVVVLSKLLEIRPTRNTGMAFGMMQTYSRLLGGISLAVIAAAMIILWKRDFSSLEGTGIMLLISGAFCNMVERLAAAGVTDFISTCLFPFAIFNVADMAVVAGCVILCIDLLFGRRENGTGKRDKREN